MLERLSDNAGKAGNVRSGLLRAAFAYAREVGRDHVDITALAEALTEAAAPYRSSAAIAGYGLADLVAWAVERTPPDTTTPRDADITGAGPRDAHEEPRQPYYPLQGLPAEEAAVRLLGYLRTFVADALSWKDDRPPQLSIRAGAGLGKTRMLFQVLAEVQRATGEGECVEMYAPEHKLAAELVEVATEYGVRAFVIRGRYEGNCVKADLADELGKLGLNVSEALCVKGKVVAACKAGCIYHGQFEDQKPAVRVFVHANLYTPRNKQLPRPGLIVVDEAYWTGAGKVKYLPLDRLDATERWRKSSGADRVAALEYASLTRIAYRDGRDPRSVVDSEKCQFMARVEARNLRRPDITPNMNRTLQEHLLREWKRAATDGAKAYRFWKLLEQACAAPHLPIGRIVLRRNAPKPGRKPKEPRPDDTPRDVLQLCFRLEVGGPSVEESLDPEVTPPVRLLDLPILALDASFEQAITCKLLPDSKYIEIPVQRKARIIQIGDKTASRAMLLGHSDKPAHQEWAAARRCEVARFADWLHGRGLKVLVVSYKALLDPEGAGPLLELAEGIDRLWFGKLRGRDGFKHHDVILIVGRQQPPVEALEATARALFGDDAEPLQLVKPDPGGHLHLPMERRCMRMADGSGGPAIEMAAHPDPRVQAVLRQGRECDSEQGMDRLRLVHREHPALVFVLSNIVLDASIDEVTTWDGLLGDRAAEVRERFADVMPESPSELARLAPDLWPTPRAAQLWLGRKGYSVPLYNYLNVVSTLSAAVAPVEYRHAGQRGSPHRATVRLPTSPGPPLAEALRLALERVVGKVATFRIVGSADGQMQDAAE